MVLLAHKRVCRNTCKFCGSKFKNSEGLKGHVKVHNKDSKSDSDRHQLANVEDALGNFE